MPRTAPIAAVCAFLSARLATCGMAVAFSCLPVTAALHPSMNSYHQHRSHSSGRIRGYTNSADPSQSLRWLRFSTSEKALFESRGGVELGDDGRMNKGAKRRCSKATDLMEEEDSALIFERVKNIRDLASVPGSGIQKGRVFRTGYLSDATESDAATLREVKCLRTLIDLRSATELGNDVSIQSDIYNGFVSIGDGSRLSNGYVADVEAGESNGDEGGGCFEEARQGSRRRYFVSLIDEGVYKKGVFQRLRRRYKAAVMALAPAALFSRRVTKKARGIFLREINAGGLVLLNELLLQYSGRGINRVLRLLASRERHPVALYCTAGKDRTGLIIALVLATLGVSDDAILDDYARSDAVYKELGDRDAMVGALAQQELDPETFLGAPRHVMEEILRFIRVKYGSVDEYLDSIGFDGRWRRRLRNALLEE